MTVESRRPGNYRLRFWLGFAATGLVWYALFANANGNSGAPAFYFLHHCLLTLVLLSGPAIAADSLSKERRDGTLGLLFLTPLTAWHLVSGKFFMHLLKLATFWALAVPLVSVPLMQGGVSSGEIAISFVLQFSSMLLVLSASLLASTFGKRWFASIITAYLLSAGVLVFVFGSVATMQIVGLKRLFTNAVGYPSESIPFLFFVGSFYMLSGLDSAWQQLFISPGNSSFGIRVTLPLIFVSTLVISLLLLRSAANRLAFFSEQEFETSRQRWFRQVFLTPRYWREKFQRTMRRKLEDNPFIWLEYRSAWSRAGRWLLVCAVILIETWSITAGNMLFDEDYNTLQLTMLYGLASIIAFTASSSFQKEREYGAFELLLVTPLRVPEIIWGRVRAVWRYYKPVFITLLLFLPLPLWAFNTRLDFEDQDQWVHLYAMAFLSFFTLPLVGLYFALRFKNFLTVLLSTLIVGLLTPAAIMPIGRILDEYDLGILGLEFVPYTNIGVIVHILISLFSFTKIHWLLTHRKVTA